VPISSEEEERNRIPNQFEQFLGKFNLAFFCLKNREKTENRITMLFLHG